MMAKVLLERRYQPASEEQLLKAFQVLDVDKNSHLTPEELKKFMMEEGEPFRQVLNPPRNEHCTALLLHFSQYIHPSCLLSSQEEVDELLQAAVDPDKGVILYKDYVQQMLPDGDQIR